MLHYAARARRPLMEPTDPPAGMPSSHRGRQALTWAVKILVSGGLLYVLLSRVDLNDLWRLARTATLGWMGVALVLYLVMLLISSWRWDQLLTAQHVDVPYRMLVNSYLVATFFNNFLPSNIGGDVIRIRDTVPAAGSKTLAATVVLMDRGIGLMGLVFIAALGSSIAAAASEAFGPVGPGLLWAALAGAIAVATPAVLRPQTVARVLAPLRRLHQEWVEARIERLTAALGRFREAPGRLVNCFVGAILVQTVIVLFYAAIARGLHVPVPLEHLAIVVPISFVVQMLPVSVNGLGVREATFGFYFTRLGLPLESAIALSFVSAVVIMLFSVSGAVVLLTRRGYRAPSGQGAEAARRT